MTEREDSLNVLLAATAGVVDEFADEVTLLRDEVLQLRGAMETRASIERARGMLMMRYGLSADASFRLLLGWSRSQHVAVHVLSARVVSLLGPTGSAARSISQPLGPGDAHDGEGP